MFNNSSNRNPNSNNNNHNHNNYHKNYRNFDPGNFDHLKVWDKIGNKNAMTCGSLPLVPLSFQSPNLGTPIRITIDAKISAKQNQPHQEPFVVKLSDSRTGIVPFKLRIALLPDSNNNNNNNNNDNCNNNNQWPEQPFTNSVPQQQFQGSQLEEQLPIIGRSTFDPTKGWTAEICDLEWNYFPINLDQQFRLELNVGESEIIANIDRRLAFRFRFFGDDSCMLIRRSINTFDLFGDVHVHSIEFTP